MTWNTGKESISRMIENKELTRVPASLEMSDYLLVKAEEAVKSCELLCQHDMWHQAVTTVWDATRFSLAALLQAQGLRYSEKASHSIIVEASTYQFENILKRQLRIARQLLRERNDNSYPDTLNEVEPEEVLNFLETAKEILAISKETVKVLTVF